MGSSRQEYWSELPCLPPGDLPDPGIKPSSLALAMLSHKWSHFYSWQSARQELYYLKFAMRTFRFREGDTLPKVTQLAKGSIQTWAFWLLTPAYFPPPSTGFNRVAPARAIQKGFLVGSTLKIMLSIWISDAEQEFINFGSLRVLWTSSQNNVFKYKTKYIGSQKEAITWKYSSKSVKRKAHVWDNTARASLSTQWAMELSKSLITTVIESFRALFPPLGLVNS